MKNDELDEMMGSATMNSGAKSQQSKSSNGSINNSGDGFNVLIIGDGHISLSLFKAMRQSRYVYLLSLTFNLFSYSYKSYINID